MSTRTYPLVASRPAPIIGPSTTPGSSAGSDPVRSPFVPARLRAGTRRPELARWARAPTAARATAWQRDDDDGGERSRCQPAPAGGRGGAAGKWPKRHGGRRPGQARHEGAAPAGQHACVLARGAGAPTPLAGGRQPRGSERRIGVPGGSGTAVPGRGRAAACLRAGRGRPGILVRASFARLVYGKTKSRRRSGSHTVRLMYRNNQYDV